MPSNYDLVICDNMVIEYIYTIYFLSSLDDICEGVYIAGSTSVLQAKTGAK